MGLASQFTPAVPSVRGLGNSIGLAYGGLRHKSWTSPNPTFGRRPQICIEGFIRDFSEKSWRPGLVVQTSAELRKFLQYLTIFICDLNCSALILSYGRGQSAILEDKGIGQFTHSHPQQWFPHRTISLLPDSYPLTQLCCHFWGLWGTKQ